MPVTFGLRGRIREAGIGRQTLPGGAYAVHTHVGSYAEAGEHASRACTAISCPSAGSAVDYDRPFVAIYLNDPTVTREMHRRTELCVPVLPVRMPLSSNDDEPARRRRDIDSAQAGWQADAASGQVTAASPS